VFALIQESNQLICRIHLTNAQAKLDDGKTLLSLLSLRDNYAEQHKILIDAIANTHRESDRYSAREIKWQKVIPVSGLQKQADDLSAKLRDLNIKIQAANWQIDLVE
jgi:hypothetical protein